MVDGAVPESAHGGTYKVVGAVSSRAPDIVQWAGRFWVAGP